MEEGTVSVFVCRTCAVEYPDTDTPSCCLRDLQ